MVLFKFCIHLLNHKNDLISNIAVFIFFDLNAIVNFVFIINKFNIFFILTKYKDFNVMYYCMNKYSGSIWIFVFF